LEVVVVVVVVVILRSSGIGFMTSTQKSLLVFNIRLAVVIRMGSSSMVLGFLDLDFLEDDNFEFFFSDTFAS